MTAGDDALSVVEVELVRVRMPLRRAHVGAHVAEDERDVVLVRVALEDGTDGWGECSALSRPTYTSEHTAGAWCVLRDELVPARLADRPSAVVGHPMAAAAIEGAELDARLRLAGRPLAVHLANRHADGHDPAPAVAVAAVAGLTASRDELLAVVAAHVAEGVALVKLKVTPLPTHLDAVAEVRRTWPELRLAVDFNGTADLAAMGALAGLDLAYVEQPAPAEALVHSALFATRTDVPIALDESITGSGALASAVALRAGAVVNVKPARLGGAAAAAALVAEAADAGLGVFVGGMLETGVGRAAAAAVAALPGCTLPTDLGPSSRYFDPDLTEPIELDDSGRLVVPTGPGTGRRPDRDRLDAVAVERFVATR